METLRLARKNVPIMVVLGAVFVLVTALAVFLLRGENTRNRLLMERDASRLASLLLEIDLNRSLLEDPELLRSAERIVGFGIYSATGSPQTRYKAAPRDLGEYDLSVLRETFVTDRQRGTLVYIRPYAATRISPMGFPPALVPTTARFLYIEMDVRDSLSRQTLYGAALAAVPVVMAALTVLAGAYALANARYREQLASQERLARLGEAARTLAHELKNPLNVIKVRARLARRNTGEDAAADLDVVEREVDHLAALTDRIREFLQDAAGTPEVVEMETYVRELCHRSAWEVVITTDGHPGYPVRFDPSRLRSVIENLVRNARESMQPTPADPPTGSPEIHLCVERDRVILQVMDLGRGFEGKDDDKLFDPFYTTKTAGSGIGLAIVRRFVEAAGGGIRLTARDPGGTVAQVTLPRAREAAKRTATRTAT